VNVLAGESDVLCRSSVPDRNGAISTAAPSDDLTALLRRIVFISEAALRLRFDFEHVGLVLPGLCVGRKGRARVLARHAAQNCRHIANTFSKLKRLDLVAFSRNLFGCAVLGPEATALEMDFRAVAVLLKPWILTRVPNLARRAMTALDALRPIAS
jgi:hypothetical protein